MFNNFFFYFANYEIMWKNVVEPDRLQITIWHMRIVYFIPNATNSHLYYLILIAFSLQ